MESDSQAVRPPTSKEPLNIVILGGSFAGLSVAHNFLQKTIEQLGITKTAPKYRVVLVSPSTHFFWNISAPRSIVSPNSIPHTKSFVPILEAFSNYPKNRFSFIHGSAIDVDVNQRNVTINVIGKFTSPIVGFNTRWTHSAEARSSVIGNERRQSSQTISYHALIFATGTSAESPLLSLHGPHEKTTAALDTFHARLRDASSIVIAGGGPSGVECAGQLATFVNGSNAKSSQHPKSPTSAVFPGGTTEREKHKILSIPKRQKGRRKPTQSELGTMTAPRKTVILISGNDRLLPRLPPTIGQRAEKQLKKLDVKILHNLRLISVQEMPSGVSRCVLGDDLSIPCDLFVAATGVHPNTQFLSSELLDPNGYINTDTQYLRVNQAGDRVYAIGDCASHSRNSITDIYDSIPILLQNLKNDLLSYELKTQYPFGGAEEALGKLRDWKYVRNPSTTQLIPITRFGGVGVAFGYSVPGVLVWLMKGRDYRISKAKLVVEMGGNPFATGTYLYK
jgi:NADH dehydrogenase FAD-containing subunit